MFEIFARKQVSLDTVTCINAALRGDLECLKYLLKMDVLGIKTCTGAAHNGHLEFLKYAHENGCPWDEWTCSEAAKNGHQCLNMRAKTGVLGMERLIESMLLGMVD